MGYVNFPSNTTLRKRLMFTRILQFDPYSALDNKTIVNNCLPFTIVIQKQNKQLREEVKSITKLQTTYIHC